MTALQLAAGPALILLQAILFAVAAYFLICALSAFTKPRPNTPRFNTTRPNTTVNPLILAITSLLFITASVAINILTN